MKKERKDQKQSHQSIQPPLGMAQEFWGRKECAPTPSSDLLHDDMQVLVDQFMDLGTETLKSELGIPSYMLGLERIKAASIF